MGLLKSLQFAAVNWLLRAKFLKLEPYGFDQAAWRAWRYADFVKDGYKRNPVVYAALRKLSQAFVSLPIELHDKGEKIDREDSPEFLKPLWGLLRRPNELESFRTMQEKWVLQMHLAGSTYFWGAGLGLDKLGKRVRAKAAPSLRLLPPDTVTIHNDGRTITSYEVDPTKNVADKRILKPEEVLWVNFTDPSNDFAGLSPLAACAYSIDIGNAALSWNFNLLKKSGVPAGVLRLFGVMHITREERREIEEDFQNRYMGAENAGSVVVVSGEKAEYKQLAMSPRELDWAGGDRIAMRQICEALGVPSVLLGDSSNRTYSNMEAARQDMYETAVIPLKELFLEELSNWLMPQYGYDPAETQLLVGVEGVKALQENENDRTQRLKQSDWWTPNEKRVADGLEEIDDPVADLLYVVMPGTLKPIDPDDTEVEDEGDEEDDEEEKEDSAGSFSAKSKFPTLKARREYIKAVERRQRRYIRKYKQHQQVYFDGQRHRVLKARGLSLDSEAEIYQQLFEGVQQEMIDEFGAAAVRQVKRRGLTFTSDTPAMKKALSRDLAARSKLINKTTAKQLQELLKANQGASAADIATEIDALYAQAAEGRAANIARTEVRRANTMASREGYKQAGEQLGTEIKMEWVTARDERVRGMKMEDQFDHVVMDGMVADPDGWWYYPFGSLGWDGSTMGPGMSGPAGFNVNCRCTIAPLMW